MDDSSSTSSSERPRASVSTERPRASVSAERVRASVARWPWALIAALTLLLIFDHTLLGKNGAWTSVVARIHPFGSLYWGVGKERALLQRISQLPSDTPSVLVLGTSRAFAGFDPVLAQELVPGVMFATMARPMLDPISVRFLATEVADAGANVVVLMLSEFDTHRPLRLEPLPDKSDAGFVVLGELIGMTDARFFARNRESLYRIAASSISRTYRFRDLLGISHFNRLRDFPLDERLSQPSFPEMLGRTALGRASPRSLGAPRLRPLLRRLSRRFRSNEIQLNWISEIQNGPHVEVQMKLVRGTVMFLLSRGIEVVLVETPLHEISARVAAANARSDFVAMAEELSRQPGVNFISLKQVPRFEPDDFSDLLHLNHDGKARMTTLIAKQIRSKFQPPSR